MARRTSLGCTKPTPSEVNAVSDATIQARTYLFVPGTRPDRFAKAFASGADAVVLDLEDAVAADDKPAARRTVAAWFLAASPADRSRTVIRINDAHSAWFADDLHALRDAGVACVLLPKAESAQHMASTKTLLPAARVLALIESARGVARVDEVAPNADRLVFGTLDFALDLDLDISEDASALAYAASRIAIASRVAGLPAPVAGVTPQLDDRARLLSDLAQSRRQGFGAKLCIHPSQVQPFHDALRPSAEALDWARRVLAADAAAPGAGRLDGRMIDLPVVRQAQRTLAHARD
jgi:citrate lyase subunit beta/citryl-CoA lyase